MAVAVCFLVWGYAILRLYTLLDRAAARGQGLHGTDRASWTNFVRVPVVIIGLVFLLWFPLIRA